MRGLHRHYKEQLPLPAPPARRSRQRIGPAAEAMCRDDDVLSMLVRSVSWLVALRPVPQFSGKVRTGLTSEICGDVYSVACAQRVGLAHGHVGLHETRSDAQPRHAGADVE